MQRGMYAPRTISRPDGVLPSEHLHWNLCRQHLAALDPGYALRDYGFWMSMLAKCSL